MGTSDLPAPVVRRAMAPPPDPAALEAALRRRVDGEVRFDAGSRAAYSTDASNYRQTPVGVVVPHTPEAAAEAVAVAREHDAGCKSDCPADVDMATYKAEFLSHHCTGPPWRRPRSDLSMGWLPVLAQALGRGGLGPAVNALTHTPPLSRAAVVMAGVEHREVLLFARQSLQRWFARRGRSGSPAGSSGAGERGTVLLWPDTFTNFFPPHVGQAAVELLEHAGWRVTMPVEPLCCGLTWISTGRLGVAERVLTRTVRHLAGHLRDGGLVVALEPRCTAVFRSDAGELFPGDRDVRRLAEQSVTPAELLTEHSPGYEPPRVPDRTARALAQVHCHQHAVLGWEADGKLLRDAGVDAERLDAGCCGPAGNFGFEQGHFSSRATFEQGHFRAGPLGDQPRLRGTRPAAAAAGGGLRHGGPRGRLQLPYPDPRVRQRRPRGRPSGRTAGVGTARVRRAGGAYGVAPGARPATPGRGARALALAWAGLVVGGAVAEAIRRIRGVRG